MGMEKYFSDWFDENVIPQPGVGLVGMEKYFSDWFDENVIPQPEGGVGGDGEVNLGLVRSKCYTPARRITI